MGRGIDRDRSPFGVHNVFWVCSADVPRRTSCSSSSRFILSISSHDPISVIRSIVDMHSLLVYLDYTACIEPSVRFLSYKSLRFSAFEVLKFEADFPLLSDMRTQSIIVVGRWGSNSIENSSEFWHSRH